VTGQTRVLSIYEGFFSGGARILHSDVLAGLHGRRGQQHSLLSIHHEMRREATIQPMQNDACYRRLLADGVSISTLGRGAGDHSPYTSGELASVAELAWRVDVLLALKEQPLGLLNRAELHGRPVVACLHRSDPENQGDALAELHAAAEAGRLAAAVCCAHSTRRAYAAAGVPEELLHVIPNGVDLRRFRPNRQAGAAVRARLGIPAEAPVVVFAARYDPMKNIPLFLAAARALRALRPDARLLLCGAGMTAANPALLLDLAAHGLIAGEGVHLLGLCREPETVYAAADVVALTSAFGEAAPLCLIEGLLCGAVPVTTDVGDCAEIVEGQGLVADPAPDALAHAWLEAIGRRDQFQAAARHHRRRFGRARMISAYGALIHSVHRTSTRSAPYALHAPHTASPRRQPPAPALADNAVFAGQAAP
jgi:glycosyltransferase involved in cell wall biosynthesis